MIKHLYFVVAVVLLASLFTGCSLGRKTWGNASSVDAFRIKTPSTDGQALFEINAGGGTSCSAFQAPRAQEETVSRVVLYSRRVSFWQLFTSDNVSSGNVSFIYISGDDESPADTSSILNGIADIVYDRTGSIQ